MEYQEAMKQLNTYYFQTEKYVFSRFDIENQQMIRIVSYEDNFSIIFDDYLLFYGHINDCTLEDLSPYSLVKILPGRSKIKPINKRLLKKTGNLDVADIDNIIDFYRKNNSNVNFSYFHYLYRTPTILAYYSTNIASHDYIIEDAPSLSFKLSFVELISDDNKNTVHNFYDVIANVWEYTDADINRFLSPDYVLEKAFEAYPDIFSKLSRHYKIDNALHSL